MTQPASVVSDGNVLVLWVTSMADPDQPALSELTDPSVLDVSCYLTDAGWNPGITEAQANDPRLCSTEDFSSPGRTSTSIPIVYVTNPDTPAEDEAALTLVKGSVGYFVERRGVPFDDPVAAGDLVTTWPVKLGVQIEQQPTANTPLTIGQMAYLRPPGRGFRKTVVAS